MITTTTKTRPAAGYRARKNGEVEEYTESTIEGTITDIHEATVETLRQAVASVATEDGEIVTVAIGYAFFTTQARQIVDITVGSQVTATLLDESGSRFGADYSARITSVDGVA